MFLLEPYEVFFGLRPENSGFIKMRALLSALAKSLRICWTRAVAALSGGGTESGFKWGNVMLTWTVEMAAAAAELSVMTSSL